MNIFHLYKTYFPYSSGMLNHVLLQSVYINSVFYQKLRLKHQGTVLLLMGMIWKYQPQKDILNKTTSSERLEENHSVYTCISLMYVDEMKDEMVLVHYDLAHAGWTSGA